jgi:hypothetical protein
MSYKGAKNTHWRNDTASSTNVLWKLEYS